MCHNIMTSLKHNNDDICPQTCGCSFFIFPTGLYRVWEIEFSHMGKTAEILIWCARKKLYLADELGATDRQYKKTIWTSSDFQKMAGWALPWVIVVICYLICRVATNISHWLKEQSRWFKNYIFSKKCNLISFWILLYFFYYSFTLYYCAIFNS